MSVRRQLSRPTTGVDIQLFFGHPLNPEAVTWTKRTGGRNPLDAVIHTGRCKGSLTSSTPATRRITTTQKVDGTSRPTKAGKVTTKAIGVAR